jgi:hypothetical protein
MPAKVQPPSILDLPTFKKSMMSIDNVYDLSSSASVG